MTQQTYPSESEFICTALNQRRNQTNDLFGEGACFWKLSDLALLYPNIFNMNSLVSQYTVNNMTEDITNHIPEFQSLTTQPVHVLKIKSSYNMHPNPMNPNEITFVKKGNDQQLSRVACEYLFRQISGTAIQQAYFMFPQKTPDEISEISKEINFERLRAKSIQSNNVFSAIVNRASGSRKISFDDVWATFWRIFYNENNMNELRARYDIKKGQSPFDRMNMQTLDFTLKIVQEIIMQFRNQNPAYIQDIINFTQYKALSARKQYQDKFGTNPENTLTDKNTYNIVEKVRRMRKAFWQNEYPISLR